MCGQAIVWRISTLDRHNDQEGNQCAGSNRKPVEALKPSRPMTAAERRLSKEMFG